jgi:hypothetical protein
MPTPASGAISMNDMRTHINRATGSSISMSEMRTRYGGSGAISFSDLYDSEGFTIDPARYYASSKFFSANNDGWSVQNNLIGLFGSISPNESNGMVQFAAASFLEALYEDNLYDPGLTVVALRENNNPDNWPGSPDTITTGYKGGDISSVVLANTSRSFNAQANSYAAVNYDMPTSGTIHCLIKF